MDRFERYDPDISGSSCKKKKLNNRIEAREERQFILFQFERTVERYNK